MRLNPAGPATKVIVNGREHLVELHALSYSDVVALAGKRPSAAWTVTGRFHRGDAGGGPGFTMLPGETVHVRPDLILNVADTSGA